MASLTACAQPTRASLPAPLPTAAVTTPTAVASTPTLAATTSPTLRPVPTATPDPYAAYTVEGLRARTYDSAIAIEQTLAVTEAFTRTLISYQSDGLTIYGFMNTPSGPGPFPVVLVNHGYIDPPRYATPLTYMTRYTDPLAEAGFITLHSDYRGYGDSAPGDNLFRVGFAIDVLNLVAAARRLSNTTGAVGMFGHSMGGGIALRTITVTDTVRAALLYGSMSGDEAANFARITGWRGDPGLPELTVPPDAVARVSPINALGNISAGISLHHGDEDAIVPPEWSADLYTRLAALGKEVEYFTYPGQPHTFVGEGQTLLLERAITLFNRTLR